MQNFFGIRSVKTPILGYIEREIWYGTGPMVISNFWDGLTGRSRYKVSEELDGIELTLRRHPFVGNAVVVQDPQQRLAAFVVPKPGAVLNLADIKYFVSKKLPEYMLPASIVTLDCFPLTHGGKIDYRALPVSDAPLQPSRTIAPLQTVT